MSGPIAGMGFATLDRIYSDTNSPVEALGGSCGNVLISLAMLGHQVAPILSFGTDKIGRSLVREMRDANCITDFFVKDCENNSPITIEYLDVIRARHSFSSICPESRRALPRHEALREPSIEVARTGARDASVFYVDRLSEATLAGMQAAAESGGIVFFEPNEITRSTLFQRALRLAHVVKFSHETKSAYLLDAESLHSKYVIRTYGRDGLTLECNRTRTSLPSLPTARVIDTCGAGDMVTVGLIHALMLNNFRASEMGYEVVRSGLVIGQRLAALNCAFVGARGAFRAFSADDVRTMMTSRASVDVTGIDPFADN